MSATVIDFFTARLRIKPKTAPAFRSLIRADAEEAVAELEAEASFDEDDAETALYIGPAGEWLQCEGEGCYCEISPSTTVSQNLTTGTVHCVKCFHKHGK